MNKSSIELNFNKELSQELLGMDLEQIKDCLKVLYEHEGVCERENRYVEAGIVKERIMQFEKLEERKINEEVEIQNDKVKKQIELEQMEEFNRFNEQYDEQLNEMNKQFDMAQDKLRGKQDKEFISAIEEFNQRFPLAPKPSSELLRLTKTMEELGKQRDYSGAHNIQVKIVKLSEQEKINWEKNRQVKQAAEEEKVNTKHNNEKNALQLKMASMFNEFKKRRASDFDILLQKSKNKNKEFNSIEKMSYRKGSKILVKNVTSKTNSTTQSKISKGSKIQA